MSLCQGSFSKLRVIMDNFGNIDHCFHDRMIGVNTECTCTIESRTIALSQALVLGR